MNLDFCIRLFVAFIVGALIGIERSHRLKEAGIRTHIIVCCTAALIMLISKYGFADLTWGEGAARFGARDADSARVAAQVVSGISFLCAGVIFKVGSSIKGLTTAAGIWLTSGMGLAIGAGMYIPTFCMLFLLYVLQNLISRSPIYSDTNGGNHLLFLVKSDSDFDSILEEQIKKWKAQVTQSRIKLNKKDGTAEYDIVIRRKEDLDYKMIKQFVKDQGDIVLSVTMGTLYMEIH
jgi:putative Mg2+ transporter-C (MgtC) family protein